MGASYQVSLSDYLIGKSTITQAQWEAIMGENPSHFKGSGQLPVETVSWKDCQEFIKKLNAKTGLTYRLPTEAEWEFAASGGNQSKGFEYAGSNNVDEVAWYWKNSGDKPLDGEWDCTKIRKNNGRTHLIGKKLSNELGIYDMSGNVWEWCQDWYGSYPQSPQTNPTGPKSGSNRVLRGGGWDDRAFDCRVADRDDGDPSHRLSYIGFRLARSL